MPAARQHPADLPSALDFDREWHRAAEEDGLSQPISRNVVRTVYQHPRGSGVTDTVRLGGDSLVNVINCVVPRAAQWTYADQEALITLRASLACDVEFRYGSAAPLVFNRPELTLTCIPPNLPMSANITAGARQQGIVAVFRARSFAQRFGLLPEDLPPELLAATEGRANMGRIASFPIDHRVAALVADTLDSRLHGELRTVQLAGRLAELVAYALEAMLHQHGARTATLPRRRDLDLARAAQARLDSDYRRPPNFADLAREIGTSQNKLKAVFKQAYGLTMADYCLERRMREAQQLLMEASLTIAQVAERVGYEHQSSFAAAFSGHVGMSPREYRKHRAPFSLDLPG
ncbi:MAG: helix-turn-helix transcriptional regulator [Betaproteobacteria bacterium]|jgi:AraC-like DNA-binding protein|nr:AraC family transcriptional regulator [Rubrivivax sp.]